MADELSTQQANANLSLYKYDASQDFDDMDQSDMITPRLVVAQSGKKAVKKDLVKDKSIYIDKIFETVMAPGEQLQVVFLKWWHEYIQWDPDKDAKDPIIARSTDRNSQLAQWAKQRIMVLNPEGKKVPKVQDVYNTLCVIPHLGWDRIFAWSFKGTHFKHFKGILNSAKLLKMVGPNGEKVQRPLFGAAYTFKVVLEEEGNNAWNEPAVVATDMLDEKYMDYLTPFAERINQDFDRMKAANSASDEDNYDPENDAVVVDGESEV